MAVAELQTIGVNANISNQIRYIWTESILLESHKLRSAPDRSEAGAPGRYFRTAHRKASANFSAES